MSSSELSHSAEEHLDSLPTQALNVARIPNKGTGQTDLWDERYDLPACMVDFYGK